MLAYISQACTLRNAVTLQRKQHKGFLGLPCAIV